MLNNIDLNRLRTITAVFNKRSVAAAASELNVTSSAVSQSIRLLEKELKTQLFLRIGKRLEPTPFVTELCLAVNQFLGQLDHVLEGDQIKAISGKVKLGAPSLFGSGALMKQIGRLRKRHPSIQIQAVLGDTKRLLFDLLEGRLDFAFLDSGKYPVSTKDLLLQPVVTEELILCCSKSFYKEHVDSDHSYKHLSGLEHIPYHDSSEAIYKWYMHHFGKAPKLNPYLMVDHPIAILNAICDDLGLGVVPASTVENRKEIVVISTRKRPLVSQIVLAEVKGKVYSRAQRIIVNGLRSALEADWIR